MKRREFIIKALATGAVYTIGGLPLFSGRAVADGFPSISNRILVNLMLAGGPDLRHLFPPPFQAISSDYGYQYWQAKASAHAIAQNTTAYQSRWENDYYHVSHGETEFGILKTCGWLKRMWDANNVAIVCNAVGGQDRDHAHCQLVLDQGDLSSGKNDFNRSGWGGRLSAVAGGNVLALTRTPRKFCYGPNPTDPLGHDNSNLISAADMRNMSLFNADSINPKMPQAIMARALKSYYAAKSQEMDPDSIYYRFIRHEQVSWQFGDAIDARLEAIPVPSPLATLTEGGLNDAYFGKQIQNLYDAFACSDILSLRVASLEYGDWDTHRDQRNRIESNLEDLFGDGKGFDALFQELPPDAIDNTVIVIAGEFGRQLKANGDGGCDHGRGNNMLVIGNAVNGGVYGQMFPQEELARLGDPTPDIVGLTELDHIFGEAADWVMPGSSASVFPDRSSAIIEPGISLANLFI